MSFSPDFSAFSGDANQDSDVSYVQLRPDLLFRCGAVFGRDFPGGTLRNDLTVKRGELTLHSCQDGCLRIDNEARWHESRRS